MSATHFEKVALVISGLTAIGIGGFILAAPQVFFASYGIAVGNDASLLSELRAPAAGLSAFGVLMLVGIWRSAMTRIAKAAALTVFLAFPVGRLIGLGVDGLPSGPIIGALILELLIAALCVVAFNSRAALARARQSGPRTQH